MLDPRLIWLGAAAGLVAYFGYASFLSPSPTGSKGQTAYTTVLNGTETRVIKIDRERCLSAPQRLWARAGNYVECIAYVASTPQQTSGTAVVFFSGDVPAEALTAKRTESMRLGYQSRASAVAKAHAVPVFVMGRPGLMGSTGSHILGGQRDEEAIIASALDQLKDRYRISRLVVGGQSGGARLVAQLLVSGRSDIACAIMASGAYGIPHLKGGGRKRTDIWGNPGNRYLVPLNEVKGIQVDLQRRTFVIGDPRDKRTPFDEQRSWADALKRAGHNSVLVEATGGGREYHYLSEVALSVAGFCAAGKSDPTILEFVRKAAPFARPQTKT